MFGIASGTVQYVTYNLSQKNRKETSETFCRQQKHILHKNQKFWPRIQI